MAASPELLAVGTIVLVAFLPPLLLGIRLRNAEMHRREPWRALLQAFLWGATGAVFLAAFAQVLLLGRFAGPAVAASILGAVVLAPLTEEISKALGLRWVRDRDPEPEDGFLYGAAAGLGFAATENVLYILTALATGGLAAGITTALVRTIATVSLHAAASAWAGYGMWQARHTRLRGVFFPFLLGAMALHAVYNLLASLQLLLALVAAVALAVLSLRRIFRRVRQLDSAPPPGIPSWGSSRFPPS